MKQDYKDIPMDDLKKSAEDAQSVLTLADSSITSFESTINEVKNQLESYDIERLFDDAIKTIKDSLESRKYIIYINY